MDIKNKVDRCSQRLFLTWQIVKFLHIDLLHNLKTVTHLKRPEGSSRAAYTDVCLFLRVRFALSDRVAMTKQSCLSLESWFTVILESIFQKDPVHVHTILRNMQTGDTELFKAALLIQICLKGGNVGRTVEHRRLYYMRFLTFPRM